MHQIDLIYTVGMAPTGEGTAPGFMRVAAHPLRWRLLAELATSDHRVSDLVELIGQPQNLISYHLRLLRGAELVTARRSSFDARDSYYHLDLDGCADKLGAAGAALHPMLRLGPPSPPTMTTEQGRRLRVLFACTGNSARSPIAEALLRHRTGGAVDVASAGSRTKEHLDPNAVRILREHYGIDISDRRPRHLDSLAGRWFDYVITLCDKVREVCPEFLGHPRLIHWSIPDPAAAADGGHDGSQAFRHAAADIDARIGHLLHILTGVHHHEEVHP